MFGELRKDQPSVFQRYLEARFGQAPWLSAVVVGLAALTSYLLSALARMTTGIRLYPVLLVGVIVVAALLPMRTAFVAAWRLARMVSQGQLEMLLSTTLRRRSLLALLHYGTLDAVGLHALVALGLVTGLHVDAFAPLVGDLNAPPAWGLAMLVLWALSVATLAGFSVLGQWVGLWAALRWPTPVTAAAGASGAMFVAALAYPLATSMVWLLLCAAPFVPVAIWPVIRYVRRRVVQHERLVKFTY